MNEFTKGKWDVSIEQITPTSNKTSYAVYTKSFDVVSPMLGIRNVSDAQLIATAGTTATKLAEQGYDAVKVVELLPQLVELVSHMDDSLAAVKLIKQCRGDV